MRAAASEVRSSGFSRSPVAEPPRGGPANRSVVLAALCVLLLPGCVQLETHIKVHEHGTATVTERVRFSRRLLDLAGNKQAELLKLLSKEAVLERMKRMGEGVQLVSYELRDADGASKEGVAVFKVEDLNKFQYASPWLAYVDYPENSIVKFKMEPLYKSNAYGGGRAGMMCVSLQFAKKPVEEPRLREGETPLPGPSPLENQLYRELGPVFRDMLRDFQVRLRFESYAPLDSRFAMRDRRAEPKALDILNFSDKDLDSTGAAFLENEEIMIGLARRHFGAADIVTHVKDCENNQTLPVFTPFGSRHMWWTGSSNISFRPSRQLFDKHFTRKMLDLSEWQASPPEKHVPAKFEEVGWKGE
jgi:hypothetical protein